jgi:hypothetical protein
VTDLSLTLRPDQVELDVDAGALPREALYAAACAFTDRCFVRLATNTASPARARIILRSKGGAFTGDAGDLLGAELRDELAGQILRQRAVDEGRVFMAALQSGAFGPPAGAAEAGGAVDDLASFDDPLGAAPVTAADDRKDSGA